MDCEMMRIRNQTKEISYALFEFMLFCNSTSSSDFTFRWSQYRSLINYRRHRNQSSVAQKSVVGCIGIRLGAVHRSMRMVRRRINTVQLKRTASGVHQIVPYPGRNNYGVIFIKSSSEMEAVFAGAHENKSAARFTSEKLVRVRMYLQADLSADRNAHKCQLHVMPGP